MSPRKFGIEAKPPHYNSFLNNTLSMGICFGAAWGILMWFIQWRSLNFPIPGAIASALATTLQNNEEEYYIKNGWKVVLSFFKTIAGYKK